ncbi:MAG: hypothetical protein MJZ85_11265 [Bacteroidales bacterium]|nr:hypothetical protein [Bacteroidales bacterium]
MTRTELINHWWPQICALMTDEVKRECDETTELDVTKTGYLKRYCEIDPAFNGLLWRLYEIDMNGRWN